MSEFGKGLTYCLGLFLCHSERAMFADAVSAQTMMKPDVWFNGASDHFYDLFIPDSLPGELRDRLNALREKALHWGHGFSEPFPTPEDMKWAVQEAKDLLLALDQHFGIECEKGDFE